MAEAEGFPPATDASSTIQRMLDLQLHQQGILPAEGESDFKPTDCFRLDPESPFQRWQREADEWDRKCLHVEEIEAALNLARKYGVDEWVPGLEKLYDPEETERIKRERYNFTLRLLDVYESAYGQPYLHQQQSERRRRVERYGPQTLEQVQRREEFEREHPPTGEKRSKAQTGGKDASSTRSWTLKDGPITASTRRSANGSKKKESNWLRTSEAAAALGWSAKYLKRQREEKGGFLSPGIHFIYGPTLKSSIVWNVDLIRGALHRRGVEARGAK